MIERLNPGTRIRFLVEINEDENEDHPAFLLAGEGETGSIKYVMREGSAFPYLVTHDELGDTFGVHANEFEVIAP